MAWTTPRTWVASEVVSAATMNTHVRDQFNEAVAAKATAAGQTVWSTGANAIAMVPAGPYKAADEIVNNSTTLQNDNHLFWTVVNPGGSGVFQHWSFRGFLVFTIGSGAPGFKLSLTVPGGSSTRRWSGFAHDAAADTVQTNIPAVHSGIGLSWPALSAAVITCDIQGFVAVDQNVNGTVQLQWAQNSAVVSDLTLLRGSYFELTRLN